MWYVIDKEGLATLCADKQDAETTAKEADLLWPKNAPHKVAKIVQEQPAPVMTDEKGRPLSFWGGKSVEPIAQPAPVHPVARIESVNETDSAYAYADGWNACVEHHKYIAKNASEKGQT